MVGAMAASRSDWLQEQPNWVTSGGTHTTTINVKAVVEARDALVAAYAAAVRESDGCPLGERLALRHAVPARLSPPVPAAPAGWSTTACAWCSTAPPRSGRGFIAASTSTLRWSLSRRWPTPACGL